MFKSEYNGLTFASPSAITRQQDIAQFRSQSLATEGSRLFSPERKTEVAPAAVASGNTFGMPQNGQIVFAADAEKTAKKAGRPAKVVAQDESSIVE